MAERIPWDSIVHHYDKLFTAKEGRPPISGRVVLGAVIIKHLLHLTDRETIAQLQENMFMQYFLGYSSFNNEAPFSPSLFVEIRERLSLDILSKINEVVALLWIEQETAKSPSEPPAPPAATYPTAAAVTTTTTITTVAGDAPIAPAAHQAQ